MHTECVVNAVSMDYQSNFEHLDWPRLPAHRGCAILSILYQLEQTQWWPAERLLGAQLKQIEKLLDHASRSVPFYRQRLADLKSRACGDISLKTFREIPVLTRTEVQKYASELLSTEPPESHGAVTEIYTSGSTGRPIRSLRTQLFELFWAAFTIRDHLWHKRDLSLKLAAIRESARGKAPHPDGEVAQRWGWASGAVFETGPCVSLNIMTTVAQQAAWLEREQPDYLLTHPSVADRLARYCVENGKELPNLRQVLTLSETLRPATRDVCRQAWNATVCDSYSTREAGYIALQCPDGDGYHIQSEGALVEVINDEGNPCRPGEIGRVLVTSLHNFAMPLIRYDVGDRAEVGENCPCGRGLPVIKQILGREQNMLIMPSGEARWPLLSTDDIKSLLAIAAVRRYQFVQHATNRIELRLEMESDLDSTARLQVQSWIRDKFGAPYEVEISTVKDLEPHASGKFFDFVNMMQENRTL